MKCKECKYLHFAKGNCTPSRYYCEHIASGKSVGCRYRMISRCDRYSNGLKIKTTPRWCPLKMKDEDKNNV